MLALSALLAVGVSAQEQRPLPRGAPSELVTRSVRVHVVVDDTLNADRLRSLARPNVVVWVHTTSNTLSEATLENLARFDDVFVELRPPIAAVDVAQFRRLPRAGVWVDSHGLKLVGALPGARRVAVMLGSEVLDEVLMQAVVRARPVFTSWAPRGEVDLLQWSQFEQLPGRKVFISRPPFVLPVKCGERTERAASVEVHVASLLAVSSEVFPCGKGARIVIEPDVDRWVVQSLIVRDPATELVLEVAHDAQKASAVRALLDELGVGPSR